MVRRRRAPQGVQEPNALGPGAAQYVQRGAQQRLHRARPRGLVRSVRTFTGDVTSKGAGPMSVHVHRDADWGDQQQNAGPGSQISESWSARAWSCQSNSEDVQSEPAAHGNLELVHVGEPGKQHRRDEGVRAKEQESVARVVVVIVGRGVITTGPPAEAGKSLKLNLAPHGPFGVSACAPPSLIATAPRRRQRGSSSRPGGRRTGASSHGAECGQGERRGRAGDARRLTRADSRRRGAAAATEGARALGRDKRTALDSKASGTALAEHSGAAGPVGSSLGQGRARAGARPRERGKWSALID